MAVMFSKPAVPKSDVAPRHESQAVPRRPARRDTPMVAPIDLALLAGLPVLTALSWLLPAAAWPAVARALTPFQLREMTRDPDALARLVARICGPRSGEVDGRNVVERLARHDLMALLLMLRALRPGAAPPAIRLSGGERIAAALADGRGAILWIGYFAYASMVAKMALHEAGHRIVHLSHPRHMFSSSWLGMRVINGVARNAEDRFLGERVLLGLDSATAALRTLAHHLGENRVVSVTARSTAKRPVRVGFFGRELALAPGALDLSFRTGAPVLPVFTVRAHDGFEVVVEPALTVDRSLPRRRATREAAQAFARLLESWVLSHPDQWQDWQHL